MEWEGVLETLPAQPSGAPRLLETKDPVESNQWFLMQGLAFLQCASLQRAENHLKSISGFDLVNQPQTQQAGGQTA